MWRRCRGKGRRLKAKGGMKENTNLIQGGEFNDARGKLIFFNDFDMKDVRRFYVIEHPDSSIIRAWQGHKKEEKWFYVMKGSFKVVLVKPDDWDNPSPDLEPAEFILKATANQVLYIPGNFANGLKALEPESRIMVFSSFTVEESSKDNFRFDKGMWYDWG
jgi:dTDP-4-dehydrorhamnose 3,5-epimerase-like enzyme